jgi:hypothetical protein
MIGDMMPMVIMIFFLPFQIIVPLIMIIKDFGLGVLIAFAVIVVFLPLQGYTLFL